MSFWDFLFYGIIIVSAILFIALTAYRIDWARHPEKYKDIAGEQDPEKVAYRQKKEAEKKAAAQKLKIDEVYLMVACPDGSCDIVAKERGR